MRGFCCHDPHKHTTKCHVAHLERRDMRKTLEFPYVPGWHLTPCNMKWGKVSSRCFVDVKMRHFFLSDCYIHSLNPKYSLLIMLLLIQYIVTELHNIHYFFHSRQLVSSVSIFWYVKARHHRLSMHLPQATCPIHHAAQLTAEQKVVARYESPALLTNSRYLTLQQNTLIYLGWWSQSP